MGMCHRHIQLHRMMSQVPPTHIVKRGNTRLIHLSPDLFPDASLAPTPFCSTQEWRQTSSSSSYNPFPKSLILTPSQVSTEIAIFCLSSLPTLLSCVHTHVHVLWFFFVCSCVESGRMRKEIKLIVPFFSWLPQVNTSQLILYHVISIASLQIKELP